MQDQVLSVGEFVKLLNQTLELAYPSVLIEGEVSSFRVSKNKWLYFDLKDDEAKVSFFGSVYNLRTPLEDGMKVIVRGSPRHHPLYGFTVNVQQIQLAGEGTIKRAFELLKKKLEQEGLFDAERKRPLPEFPHRIGLITSEQAAAYSDFIKILDARWGGIDVKLADVLVQGEHAPAQLVNALEYFNQQADLVDVIVMTRGGGSLEDLSAFNDEMLTRVVAASRIPTVVGVGHEVDVSLAELAADMRAATPSNAAQLVVPERSEIRAQLERSANVLSSTMLERVRKSQTAVNSITETFKYQLAVMRSRLQSFEQTLTTQIRTQLEHAQTNVRLLNQTLASVNPRRLLKRGYSIARDAGRTIVTDASPLKKGDRLVLELHQGSVETEVKRAKAS